MLILLVLLSTPLCALLRSPILNEASKSEVYLPEGQWHPFNRAGEIITGPRSAVEEASIP